MRKSTRDIVKNNLGRKVRELRLSLEMSQADQAGEAEIRRALISEMSEERRTRRSNSILRIATASSVDLAKLFNSRR